MERFYPQSPINYANLLLKNYTECDGNLPRLFKPRTLTWITLVILSVSCIEYSCHFHSNFQNLSAFQINNNLPIQLYRVNIIIHPMMALSLSFTLLYLIYVDYMIRVKPPKHFSELTKLNVSQVTYYHYYVTLSRASDITDKSFTTNVVVYYCHTGSNFTSYQAVSLL